MTTRKDALGEAQLTQLLNLLSNSKTASPNGAGAGSMLPAGGTKEQLKMMREEWAEASRSELRFMLRIYRQSTPEPGEREGGREGGTEGGRDRGMEGCALCSGSLANPRSSLVGRSAHMTPKTPYPDV